MPTTQQVRPNWFRQFFTSICSSWIQGRNKEQCTKAKDLITLIGSLSVSTLGLLGALQIYWLFAIALLISLATILLFLGLQCVLKQINEDDAAEIRSLSQQVEKITKELDQLSQLYTQEQSKSKYRGSLLAETTLLAQSIRKANANKSAKGLYSKITNSVVQMILNYLEIEKENFSVHLYAYDGKTEMVRRVDVESFVTSKQAADENEPRSIHDGEVSKRYYAKALMSRNTYFALPDTDAIQKNLHFSSDDAAIISQYSQYAGMVCKAGNYVKLYVEIISYNGLMFGKDKEALIGFVQKVVAPFSSLLSIVDWTTIRSDCYE